MSAPHQDHEHDLALKKGDIVEVISATVTDLGPGWSCGRCQGKMGFFPANYGMCRPILFTNFTLNIELFAVQRLEDVGGGPGGHHTI